MSKDINSEFDFPDLNDEQVSRFRRLPGESTTPLHRRLQMLKEEQLLRKKTVLFDENIVDWFSQKGMDISSLVTPMLKEFMKQEEQTKHL